MDRILELLARGADQLTAGELSELAGLVQDEATRLEGEPETAANVQALGQLADAGQQVQAASEALAASAAAARTRRPDLSQLAGRRPASRAPEARRSDGPAPATATVRARNAAGMELATFRDLVDEIVRTAPSAGRGRFSGRRGVTIETSYPDARRLRSGGSGDTNEALVAAATQPQALVAAGGLCAPVPTDYGAFSVASTARPVRDALPSFQADHGGVELRPGTTLADVSGAAGVWTLQNDIDAGTAGVPDPTKAILRLVCPAFETFTVDAVTLRLATGNINARFDSEGVVSMLEVAQAAHARLAENNLIAGIEADSVAVTATGALGAAREFLSQVDQAVARYRTQHRMDDRRVLRLLAPSWLREMLRVDFTRQAPGDSTTAITNEQIDAHLRVRGVNPIWTIDDLAMAGVQAAGALIDWPATVEWFLWAEGSFLFLDGGTLELGWMRDSALNEVNDVEFFSESFEGVAFRGVEPALKVTSTIDPTGFSAGHVNPPAAA